MNFFLIRKTKWYKNYALQGKVMKKNIVIAITVICSCFALYFYSLSKNSDDTIYFLPGYHKNLFGNDKKGFFNIANIIEEKGYKVVETTSYKNLKNAKYIVIFDIHKKKLRKIKRLPQKKIILFTWEPPCVISMNHEKKYHRNFAKVFTFNDDLIDNKKYFKFYYPDAKPMIKNDIDFDKKKFCCQITSDKSSEHLTEIYSERRNAIKYFEEYAPKDFDLYGTGWEKAEFKSYLGPIRSKLQVMKKYKFSICYENSKNVNGYITEKIFDSFQAACVPVYLGADNISDYIPENCFIDKRKFKSYNELYVFLKTMTKEEHMAYLNNINEFLNSDSAKLFTGEKMVQTFKKALDLDKGIL